MTDGILVDIATAPPGGCTLVCVPHAGAGVGPFSRWRAQRHPHVGLSVVRLPGRDDRCLEDPPDTMEEITAAILPELTHDRYDDLVLYGHCTGGLVAYELAQLIRRHGRRPPRALVVSSAVVPAVMPGAPRTHCYADERLKAYMLAFTPDGGTDVDDELWELIGPAIRADLRAAELADYSTEPLDVPIVALHGADDHVISRADMQLWAGYTRSTFTLTELPGGHVLLDTCAELLAREALSVAAG